MMENKRKNKKQLESKPKQTIKQTMTTNWINYEDKVPILTPEVPNINLVNSNDMNSIKWTVMKGIPLFHTGQVMMFFGGLYLYEFLAKFNLIVNSDYQILTESRYLFNFDTQLSFRGGTNRITLTKYNLPTENFLLNNNYVANTGGRTIYHKGAGGNTSGTFPVISGFWSASPLYADIVYSIRLNPNSTITPIEIEPPFYTVNCLVFLRDIFAEDIKKV